LFWQDFAAGFASLFAVLNHSLNFQFMHSAGTVALHPLLHANHLSNLSNSAMLLIAADAFSDDGAWLI